MKTLIIALTFYPMWHFDILRLREDQKKLDFNCRECPNYRIKFELHSSLTSENTGCNGMLVELKNINFK